MTGLEVLLFATVAGFAATRLPPVVRAAVRGALYYLVRRVLRRAGL